MTPRYCSRNIIFRYDALIRELTVLSLFTLSAMLEITDSQGMMMIEPSSYAQYAANTTSQALQMKSAAASNVTTAAISIHDHSATNSTSVSAAGIVDQLREGNQSSFGITNDTSYVFSPDKSEISTPNNNTHTGDFGVGVDIALVLPSFTAAAYNNDNFYSFYRKYANVQYGTNVTTDLGMLYASVSKNIGTSAFAMLDLLQNLKWVTPQSNITVISDADVDSGNIFLKNGSNGYDVVILGHQEYVTQREYDNFKRFVSNGGTMIILDGNVFYAQVDYDNSTQTIRLVKGHGWAFNGKSAWRSIGERWANETAKWVGSNYLCYSCEITFANNPFRYRHHEENYVTNPNDIILLNYNATDYNYNTNVKHVIASYELNYGMGKVIALGIYSDDIIINGKFDRFLDSLLLQYAPRIRD
jgi:hypothetical protein